MTDSPTLREWFEDVLDDADFGDFTEGDIAAALKNANDNFGSGKNVTGIIDSATSPSFLDAFIGRSSALEKSFEKADDLKVYQDAINRGFKVDIAKNEGIPLAIATFKSEFKSSSDYTEAQEFLRVADPRRLGGFKRGEQQIAQKAFRQLFQ